MSNKYGSKIDTFIASDLYNLPLPVLPPADLSLSPTVFAPSFLFYRTGAATKVAGFTPNDNAFIRSLALTSNLADGLVASSSSLDAAAGWNIKLEPELYTAPILGISNTAGDATIAGGAGNFLKYLAPGAFVMWRDDNGVVRTGIVDTVTDGDEIELTAVTASGAGTMFAGDTTSGKLHVLVRGVGNSINFPFATMNDPKPYHFFAWDASLVYVPQGKITVVVGSTAVVGSGTAFNDDYIAGMPIAYTDNVGIRRTGIVSTVTDDTHLTLTDAAIASATMTPILDINSFVALKATVQNSFDAYTISIDPAYGNGTRRFSLGLMAEIEYTFAMTGAI